MFAAARGGDALGARGRRRGGAPDRAPHRARRGRHRRRPRRARRRDRRERRPPARAASATSSPRGCRTRRGSRSRASARPPSSPARSRSACAPRSTTSSASGERPSRSGEERSRAHRRASAPRRAPRRRRRARRRGSRRRRRGSGRRAPAVRPRAAPRRARRIPCSSLSFTIRAPGASRIEPKSPSSGPGSDVSALLPASSIARSGAGRLTTVACTVSATSSSCAAPAATVARSWKAYVPTRYSVTSGRSSPLAHIAGVPPAETTSTSSPRARRADRLGEEVHGARRRRIREAARRRRARPRRRSPLRARQRPRASHACPAEAGVAVDEHPQRPHRPAAAARAPAAGRASSAQTVRSTRSSSARSRASFDSPRMLNETRMSSQPAVGHHLGLAELLARDPARAELELAPRDLDASVRLHVRAVARARPGRSAPASERGCARAGRGRRPRPESRSSTALTTACVRPLRPRRAVPAREPASTVVRAGNGSEKNSRVHIVVGLRSRRGR